MDDKSITDLLSQMIPDDSGQNPSQEADQPEAQDNILVEGLKSLVGHSEGELEKAVEEFLKGKGALHEITNSAVTRSKSTAEPEIAEILAKTFKLSPAMARLIAPLLTNLLPFTKKDKEKESTSPKKPRRKTKPKTSSKEKEETSSKKKPPKKTAAKPKPAVVEKEEASSKKKPKKKTTTKPKTSSSKPKTKKKATTSSKPKKAK